jgi:RNA methyltransferase, TrmH family
LYAGRIYFGQEFSQVLKNTGFTQMLSKNRAKFIQGLQLRKNREEQGLFIAEGKKIVGEILRAGSDIKELYISEDFYLQNHSLINEKKTEVVHINPEELKKISTLKNPDDALAVCAIPAKRPDFTRPSETLVPYLDGIRDPGNLGAILRVCDWFGINTVFCSPDCTDLYNSKTIQASMGSFLRVEVIYLTLGDVLKEFSSLKIKLPVYAAQVQGASIYTQKEWKPGILLIGNEANGISKENLAYVDQSLSIPSFSGSGAESLNAAIAASLLIAEYRRKKLS